LAKTDLSDVGRGRYALTIGRLGDAMRIARQLDRSTQIGVETGTEASGGREGTGETRKRQSQVAECGCGRRLRMAPSVLAAGPVICGVCEAEFTVSASAQAERPAEAVIDQSFMGRRQAALERGGEPGRASGGQISWLREHTAALDDHEANALVAERAKLEAALSLVSVEHADAAVPLRERTDRLSVLLAQLCQTVSPESTPAVSPTAVQRDGVRQLVEMSVGEREPLVDWYRRFSTPEEQPMAARSNVEREHRVALARSLLKADGTLTGVSVHIDGRVHGRRPSRGDAVDAGRSPPWGPRDC
jgi:hypothetical protein